MEELTIEQLATFQKGFAFKSSDYRDNGIRIIKVSNLNQQRFDDGSCVFIDESIAKEYARYELITDDIVISTVGSWINNPDSVVGKVASIPSMITGSLLNQNAVRLRANYKIMQKYLYYALSSDDFRNYIVGTAQGSANQASITLEDIKKYSLSVPPYEIQSKIISILSSIDSKIEINRRINDNLEQQASSLLSDWISTYPCRTYKLSDICKYANAKCETGNLTPQNYISTENMLPNRKGIVEASNIPTGKATCYKVDDVLIANIRPYFQKIWKADINGGCSADVLCIRANIESHSPILYWLLHQDAFFEYVMTGAKGCKMPRGDKQHIMNWSIDLPEVQYWADLATQLGSIDQQIAYNRIESINLSNLRDTLLPKLMSGELEINEIDC